MKSFCRWWKKDVEELRSHAAESKKRTTEAEEKRYEAIRALNKTRQSNRELQNHLIQNGWSELLQEAMRGAR